VVLSPAHAHALLRLLDRVLERNHSKDHSLGDVHQRLSDAIWLSRWLRENVVLKLQETHILDLTEAVLVMLDELQWSEDDCRLLQAVSHQLSLVNSMPAISDASWKKPNLAAVASR
jgi:hypothetical protein